MSLKAFAALICLFTGCLVARGDTIASASGGTSNNTNSSAYVGQSFTVTGAGAFNQITFNFYSSTGTSNPYAVGNGYLFSSAFTGTPSQLSSASTGLLGKATSANGLYAFNTSLILLSGNQYFFYEDAPIGTIYGNNGYAGGLSYFAQSSSGNYVANASANFLVTGQAVTPEPSSLLLLGTGLLGAIGAARKRFA